MPCTGRCSEKREPADSGVVVDLNVKPQQVGTYRIVSREWGDYLNIDFKLKNPEPLMDKGQTVAYAQIPVSEECAVDSAYYEAKYKINVIDKKNNPEITITSKVGKVDDYAVISFSRATGLLTAYKVNGRNLRRGRYPKAQLLACTDRQRHGSPPPQAFPRVERPRDETRQPHLRQGQEHTSRHR